MKVGRQGTEDGRPGTGWGGREGWGAEAYAAIASIIHTTERSGVHAFHAIQSFFGTPALPLQVDGE